MRYYDTIKFLRGTIVIGASLITSGCLPLGFSENLSFFHKKTQKVSHNQAQSYSYTPYYEHRPIELSYDLDGGSNNDVIDKSYHTQFNQSHSNSSFRVNNAAYSANYSEQNNNASVSKSYNHSMLYTNNAQKHTPYKEQSKQSLFMHPINHPSTHKKNVSPYYDYTPKTLVTTLPHSLHTAYNASPRIAAEKLKIEEANERLIQAKSASQLKSELRGSFGARQSNTVYNVVNRQDTNFRLGQSIEVDVSLPLFQGGRAKAQKKSAKVGIKTAKANLDRVEGQVLQQGAIAYLEVIRDRQLVSIYSQNVRILEEQQHAAKLLLAQNENTVSDMALIDARLATIRISLEIAVANLKSSESKYHTLVGSAPPTLLPVPTLPIPASLYEVKMIAKENNPEIHALQAQAESAIYDVDFAKSSSKPTLALQGILRGSRGQSESINRNTAAEVLLNLRIPLLSGGENKSKVRQAELAKSRIALEAYSITQSLNENTEFLWANLQAAKRNSELNYQQIEAAELAYKSISRQREAGLATTLDMFAIEQTLLDSRLDNVRAKFSEASTRVQLLNLMGRLKQTTIIPSSNKI